MMTSTNIATLTEIPIIDISPLIEKPTSLTRLQETVELIREACKNIGFFYIKNHGVPQTDCEAMFTEAQRFFSLPMEEKMKLCMEEADQFRGYVPVGKEVTQNKKDWHECLDLQPKTTQAEIEKKSSEAKDNGKHPLDDPGQWPSSLPKFHNVMMKAWDCMYELSEKITEGLALSLELDIDYFKPYIGNQLCALRLIHYPPYQEEHELGQIDLGFGEHCDYGFLAVLQQDDAGGLEIRNANGEWIPAYNIPGTFLVNIGLMMQHWTNDLYRATWHRVQIPRTRSRYAIPFFFEPAYNALIEPLSTCCDIDHPPRYEPCLFGEHVTKLFSKAYR